MMHYRGWTVLADDCVVSGLRARFTFVAVSHDVRCIGVFADVHPGDRRRDVSEDAPAVAVNVNSVVDAVGTADEVSIAALGKEEAERRQLVVLLLRSDSAVSVNAPTQHFIDSCNLNAGRSRQCYLEVWHIDTELSIDVLGHTLNSYVDDFNVRRPRHRLATEEEKKKFPAEHLPKMLLSDPVARWMGFRENDVVVEMRDEQHAGRQDVLRRVVV